MQTNRSRRRGSAFGRDTRGSAAILGFVVGTAFSTLLAATVIHSSQQRVVAAPYNVADAPNDVEASRLTANMLSTPGLGWSVDPCDATVALQPDPIDRFGLAVDACSPEAVPAPLNLSFDKVANLRKGGLAANATNAAVDYGEAKDSLGLPSERDFHLDIRVPLEAPRAPVGSGQGDGRLSVLYLAHYLRTGAGDNEASDAVRPETTYLRSLVRDFDPHVYDEVYASDAFPYAAGGDIVPDNATAMESALQDFLLDDAGGATLTEYNVVVAGSRLTHGHSLDAEAEDALRRWVEIGGVLIVLGSNVQTVGWMDAFLHPEVVTATGNGEIVLPDHPAVKGFRKLGPLHDGNAAWKLNAQEAAKFTTVAKHGSPTLLVSGDDSFGDGRVLLTSFQPYSPGGAGATDSCDPESLGPECAGLRLLRNLLGFAFEDLRVDYGPDPTGGAATVVSRIASAWHPRLGLLLELEVRLVYFAAE